MRAMTSLGWLRGQPEKRREEDDDLEEFISQIDLDAKAALPAALNPLSFAVADDGFNPGVHMQIASHHSHRRRRRGR